MGKGHLPSSAREGSLIQLGGAKIRSVLVFVVDKAEKNCENHERPGFYVIDQLGSKGTSRDSWHALRFLGRVGTNF